jgi:hypothetical protein
MKALVKLARALAGLDADAREFVDEYVKLLGEGGGESDQKAPKKVKRAYKKREKAVEVAPGVSVVRRPRSKGSEIDHSPRSVEDQVAR